MLASCVRLSVHLSVTRLYCTKTAKCKTMQTTPYDSPGTLVFWRQNCLQNFDGVTPTVAPNRGGVVSDWWSSSNISLYLETGAREEHSYNGMLIETRMHCIEWHYFQWPWEILNYPKPPHFRHFVLSYLRGGGDRDFKFGRWTEHSKCASPRTANHHWKRRGQVTWTI